MTNSSARNNHHLIIGEPIYPADELGETYEVVIGITDGDACYVEYNDSHMERHRVNVPVSPHLSEPEWLNASAAWYVRSAWFRGFGFSEIGKNIFLDTVRTYARVLNDKIEKEGKNNGGR